MLGPPTSSRIPPSRSAVLTFESRSSLGPLRRHRTSPIYGGDTFPAVGAAHTQWVVVVISHAFWTWRWGGYRGGLRRCRAVAQDATPDCAVEVRNRWLRILRTSREDGRPRDDGIRPARDDKAAVLGVLQRFDPLLPKQCAVTHGLAARARDPQRPVAAIIDPAARTFELDRGAPQRDDACLEGGQYPSRANCNTAGVMAENHVGPFVCDGDGTSDHRL